MNEGEVSDGQFFHTYFRTEEKYCDCLEGDAREGPDSNFQFVDFADCLAWAKC